MPLADPVPGTAICTESEKFLQKRDETDDEIVIHNRIAHKGSRKMNLFLRGMMQAVAESFTLPEPILEIGSYQVEGQADILDLRSMFPGKDYVGTDFRAGPGVDLVADVEKLSLPDASVGTVIALSTFEHVEQFWLGFKEVERVLRPDGVFVVASPFYFHVHAYPNDYWRFTPEALKSLLRGYPTKIVGSHGPDRRMANVWSIAFKDRAAQPTNPQLEAYKVNMAKYAREPLPWARRLKYQLGRVLCGRRPFAVYLDRERWSIEVERTVTAVRRAA